MLYTTTIPVGGAEEKELRDLAASLSKIAGKPVQIDLQFVISTESPDLSAMFDTLKDSILARESVKSNGHSNGHRKAAKAKKAPEMSGWSMRNVDTGEIISTRAVKKMVADGIVMEQSAFENSKGERFVVIERELVKEPKAEQS